MAKSSTASAAKRIAREGTHVRDRVRDLTVRSLKARHVEGKDLSKVVNQVLEGAKQGVHDAVPQSQRSVLKQVLDGLGEAADIAARTGAGALRDARDRGESTRKDAAAAVRRVRDANDEFLDAAGTFARKLSGELRDEMDDLVARARRAAPKIRSATGSAIGAADGRLLELGGEAARSGVKIARSAIGGLMMATGGLLEGLADSITPNKPPRPATPATAARKKARTKARKQARRNVRKKARKTTKRGTRTPRTTSRSTGHTKRS